MQRKSLDMLQSKHQPFCPPEGPQSFGSSGKEGMLFALIPGCSAPQMLFAAICFTDISERAARPAGLCQNL